MSENSNFIVELFIRTLEIKHKLTFEKDKAEYFRVLFDTYLNGQGNPEELRDYIAAGIDDPNVIDTLAAEVLEWQVKAAEMKAAEETKKKQEQQESKKMEEYVENKTKEAKDAKEVKDAKEEGEKKEVHGRKKHKRDQNEEKKEQEGGDKQKKEQGRGLKGELASKGKEKCKFYPFCKNPQSCGYFHPTDKCTYFPNCRYGQACLYEHETCKYKEKCMKPNCPFAHPFKKSNPIEQMMKTFMNQHNPLNRSKKRFPKSKEPQNQDAPNNEEQPKKE